MKTLRDTLTKNEIKLFISLGGDKLLDLGEYSVLRAYDMLAVHAFLENKQGKEAESLRKALKHLYSGKFRCTDEFEKLIEIT